MFPFQTITFSNRACPRPLLTHSSTRDAATQFGSDSIDVVARLTGIVARVPFLAILFGTYFAAWQKAVGKYGAAMLVMAAFIGFNPVLFIQYLAWLMPLLPLAVAEWMSLHQMNSIVLQNSSRLQKSYREAQCIIFLYV